MAHGLARIRFQWKDGLCKVTAYKRVGGGRRAVVGTHQLTRATLKAELSNPDVQRKLGLVRPLTPDTRV